MSEVFAIVVCFFCFFFCYWAAQYFVQKEIRITAFDKKLFSKSDNTATSRMQDLRPTSGKTIQAC